MLIATSTVWNLPTWAAINIVVLDVIAAFLLLRIWRP